MRTWTDRSGAFKVEAQFIGLKDGKIHLHKLNGVKIAVPVAKMAVEDLEYVEAVTGQSLDDDKPLSNIKRRSTQRARAGASIESPRPPPKDEAQYDWFDFFLKAGVSPYQCERYAYNFNKDSMDENILAEISPSVLRTLGLKEGDILRVMKYLDAKFGRNGKFSNYTPLIEGVDRVAENSTGGLFSGAGGALVNNTKKGRPAPPVQSNNVVDENALRPRLERITTPLGPPTPKKDGFADDTWDVRPSRKPSASFASAKSPTVPSLSTNLLDLSLLQEPLQPTPTSPPKPSEAPKPVANAALFQKVDQTGLGIEGSRQRPPAPSIVQRPGSLMPPPPVRPAQPQMGYQIAAPGQSLNELNQQRLQPFLPPQNTGYPAFNPQTQNPYLAAQQIGSPFVDPRISALQPQSTGFQLHHTGPNLGLPSSNPMPPNVNQMPPINAMPPNINSMLPPALQPQVTGAPFGLAPPAPLVAQRTGPAPPVRFGAPAANKLQPQSTGRKANLDNATPSNPFGF